MKSLKPQKGCFLKLIFLDRDGVINKFPGVGHYVIRPEDFEFIPGSIEAIRLLKDAGFELHVISNQGCVTKGEITLKALQDLTQVMLRTVEKGGGKIDGVFYCVHESRDLCECKKPKTALLKQALRGRKADIPSIFFIGDSQEDMQAAENLGCQKLLVLSGRTRETDLETFQPKPDFVKKDLWEAAQWILQRKS
jgi:D-glycero-D-manno-heptose 1,7-bisphosphate phosphatase